MKSFFTKYVMLVTMLIASFSAMAADFEVDGIGYDIVSAADLTCQLIDGRKATGDVVIPEKVSYKGKELSVLSIKEGAFEGNTSITSILLPGSVKSIGINAFYGCTSLASVTIPGSVKSIGSDAFHGCTSLASVTIPGSVKSIGINAFYGCTSLASVTISSSVTSIENGTFYGCISLASVTIPDSVTTIDNYAFYGCTSLASVTIPGSVKSIGGRAFYGCTSLASVTIPSSVTSIDSWTFSSCTKEIHFSDGVDMIKSKSYYNFAPHWMDYDYDIVRGFDANSIYIGRNIYLVTNGRACSPFTDKLERLIIGGCATSLQKEFGWDYAYSCDEDRTANELLKCPCKLKYLEIQNAEGVLTLDFDILSTEALEVVINRATKATIRPDILKFGDDVSDLSSLKINTSRLKTVTFGQSISDIPAGYLNGDEIEAIYMRSPQPPTYTGSIRPTTYTDATLYVPMGSLEAYQAAEPWKTFWDIQEIDMESGIVDITASPKTAKPDVNVDGKLIHVLNADGMAVSVYNTDGTQVWHTDSYSGDAVELHSGMHIVRVGNHAIKLAI